MHQVQDAASVNDADDIVQTAAVRRQARVHACRDAAHYLIPLRVQVDADDAVARYHDVFDGCLFEVEDRQQHILVRLRDQHTGFEDHRPQFLGADGLSAARVDTQADQTQQPVGDTVDDPHDRINQPKHRPQHEGARKGDALGI